MIHRRLAPQPGNTAIGHAERVLRPGERIVSGQAALGATGLFSLPRAGVRRMKTELVVSTRRIIYKPGWVGRGASEVDLGETEILTVSQGVLGPRFYSGAVTVRAVGPVANVAAPWDVHLASGPPRPERPARSQPLAR